MNSNKHKKDFTSVASRRRGIILFVVMGAIFVLAILILSYNHFIREKFHENREIITHINAMKYAQAISRYTVARMQNDLLDPNVSDANSPGNILRSEVFTSNSASELNNKIKSMWLNRLTSSGTSGGNTIPALVEGLNGSLDVKDLSFSIDIMFSDLVLLSSIAEADEFFLGFEKAGKMTISVEVKIGRTVELWQEVRPFRVVVPYPVPLTKFSLYLRKATDNLDPVKFNTVRIASPNTGQLAQGSPVPLVLHHGRPGRHHNEQEDIWKRRGWVYLGGGPTLLNRAAGARGSGQRYFSYYPNTNLPVALILNFAGFNGVPVGSQNLIFRKARWGFSESFYNGPDSTMWKEMLGWHMQSRPPDTSPTWWQSSCLHLFGEVKTSSDPLEHLSITRVSGAVYDRFVDVGYLVPSSGSLPPVAGLICHNRDEFESITGKPGAVPRPSRSSMVTRDLWVDNELVVLAGSPDGILGVSDLREMEDFFENMAYSSQGTGPSYEEIMSKTHYSAYDEAYNMIAQYAQNSQAIGIPPRRTAPKIDDFTFAGFDVLGQSLDSLQINNIAETSDAALGMKKRVCYEIPAQDRDEAFKLLSDSFTLSQNNDLRLANSVVRVNTGGRGMLMQGNLGIDSGGTIIVDGPVSVGHFKSLDTTDRSPLVIMAETGNLTVDNSQIHPILAYLVALDQAGAEIKLTNPNQPLNLLGGIAAHTLTPAEFVAGGEIHYNSNLDPTDAGFASYIGVVLGPPGGEI